MQLFHRTKRAPTILNTCPRCGHKGKVQVVDLVQGIDVVQCHPCGNRWELARPISEQLTAIR